MSVKRNVKNAKKNTISRFLNIKFQILEMLQICKFFIVKVYVRRELERLTMGRLRPAQTVEVILEDNMKFSQMYFVLMLIFHDCDARIIDQSGSSSSSSEKWGKTLKYHIKDPLRKYEYSKNISIAVDDFKKNVNCMKFEEVKDGDDVDLMSSEYILFEDAGPGSGCHSQVGRQRGRRPARINLDVSFGCTDLAIIKQQMMHSLGLDNSHLQ